MCYLIRWFLWIMGQPSISVISFLPSLKAKSLSPVWDGIPCTSRNVENLLQLNLSNVFSNKEGEENLELIATKCPNLESITFERCTGVYDKGVKFIISNCRNLKKMFLIGLSNINDDFIKEIRNNYPLLELIYET